MTDMAIRNIKVLTILKPFDKMVIKRFLLGGLKTKTVQKVKAQAKISIAPLKEEIALLEKLIASS